MLWSITVICLLLIFQQLGFWNCWPIFFTMTSQVSSASFPRKSRSLQSSHILLTFFHIYLHQNFIHNCDQSEKIVTHSRVKNHNFSTENNTQKLSKSWMKCQVLLINFITSLGIFVVSYFFFVYILFDNFFFRQQDVFI